MVKPTFTPDLRGAYVAKLVVSDGTMTSEARVTLTAADTLDFDAIPNPFPANYVSYSVQAYGIKGIGEHAILNAIAVAIPLWVQISHIRLLSRYSTTATPCGSKTDVVTMPYRPPVHPTCPILANFQYPARQWQLLHGRGVQGDHRPSLAEDRGARELLLRCSIQHTVGWPRSHRRGVPD